MLEPQHGEPRACQDTQQQDLDLAQVLATIEALQLDLDFCRGANHKQLVQLQEQECAVEQEHQDLVILMQQLQALMSKVPVLGTAARDQAACVPHCHPSTGLPHIMPAPQPVQTPGDATGKGREHPASHTWLEHHLHRAAQPQGKAGWHSPVHPAEQSWKNAGPNPNSPTDTLGTIPGLVAAHSLANELGSSLSLCPCCATAQGPQGWPSRAAGCPADTATTGRALWELHRDERARSQLPSCLPPDAGHIPLSQALPNSPLSMDCPKKAPSAASVLQSRGTG